MSRHGIRRAIGFIAAAHRSYSGCLQYRENVIAARARLSERRLADVEVTYVDDWYMDAGFVQANADHVREALERLPVISVHTRGWCSPRTVSRSRWPSDIRTRRSSRRQHGSLPQRWAISDFATVYQSRSGRPEDPWLGPDVGEYLRQAKADGVPAVGPVSDRVSFGPHRGSLRPRRRGRGCLPRDRTPHGARGSGQHAPAVPGRDGRCGPADRESLHDCPAAPDCPAGTTLRGSVRPTGR